MQFEDTTPSQLADMDHTFALEDARRFCNYKDSRDWFFKHTNTTLSESIESESNRLQKIDRIMTSFINWYDGLRQELEEYEEYEWCVKIQPNFEKIHRELKRMRSNIAGLQGQLEF